MVSAVFDTLKAAKELIAAGFNESQAESVVATIGGAVTGNLATKADLEQALKPVVTDEKLDRRFRSMVTNEKLDQRFRSMVTKEYLDQRLESMVTKEYLDQRLESVVTKEHLDQRLESMVTKTDLLVSQQQVTIRLGALLVAGISALAVLQRISWTP